MRQYHDQFEQLLAEVIQDLGHELAKPKPQDFQEKNFTKFSLDISKTIWYSKHEGRQL